MPRAPWFSIAFGPRHFWSSVRESKPEPWPRSEFPWQATRKRQHPPRWSHRPQRCPLVRRRPTQAAGLPTRPHPDRPAGPLAGSEADRRRAKIGSDLLIPRILTTLNMCWVKIHPLIFPVPSVGQRLHDYVHTHLVPLALVHPRGPARPDDCRIDVPPKEGQGSKKEVARGWG